MEKIQRGIEAALQIISGMMEEKTSLAWPIYVQCTGQFTSFSGVECKKVVLFATEQRRAAAERSSFEALRKTDF